MMLLNFVVSIIFFAVFIVVGAEPGNPQNPGYECRCYDPNAIFKLNPSPCPGTCAFPGGWPCNNPQLEQGCECRPGFYLNDWGQCVQLHDCPGAKKCSVNETFVFCNYGCPINECPKDDYKGIIACFPPYPCESGCACIKDYLRSSDGRCLLYSDCPPVECRRPNEVYSARPPPCLFEECTDIGKDRECHVNYNRPKCVCKPGYYRDHNDVCVSKEECFKLPPKCGVNEHHLDCMPCPPLRCEMSYTDYICLNGSECVSGCECLPGYLRDANNVCIPKDQCPPPPVIPICGEFEELSKCAIVCPPQTCASRYTLYKCAANITCEWGCDCIRGYLRNADGKCIPSDQCSNPIPCGYNEAYTECLIECPPLTCDSIFTSYMCSNETKCKGGCDCMDGYLRNASGVCVPNKECFSGPKCDISPECRPTCANPEPECSLESSISLENVDGCKCKDGYILFATNGPCVRVDECPDLGCNGDPNSIVTSCPWPCISTCNSPEAGNFGHKCDAVGCQCKPGFILEEETGLCIEPEKCKSGNPCGVNGTFADCAFPCPNQYCRQYEDQPEVACKPGRPCASGCLCKPGYLKLSYDDETCVLEEDCPKPCNVRQDCRPNCAVPNPPDCPYIPPSETNIDSCNCQAGFVLSEVGGKCIKVEECQTKTCNSDPHARIKECPQPCPSTCSIPNAYLVCKRKCDPIGCECESGYLRGQNGSCILPEECPGGNPCGKNEMFSSCLYQCPTNFCPTENTRVAPVCETFPFAPCISGCACRLNHRRLSVENPKCILSSDCPPLDCPENEEWNPCPSECQSEYCDAVDEPKTVCNTLILNCNPSCRCKKNYFRRDDGTCVYEEECRKLNRQKEKGKNGKGKKGKGNRGSHKGRN